MEMPIIETIHQSDLNLWLRCGKQYEFYLTHGPIPPGIAARRGSSVHKAADLNHSQKITSKKDLPLNDLREAAWETFQGYIRPGNFFLSKDKLGDKIQIIKEAETQTLGAVELYHKEVAPLIEPTMSEQKFEVDIGLPLPLAGRIDADDKGTIVQDLKCMVTKNQHWADRQIQPTVYHLGYQELTGRWPEHLRYDLLVPNVTPKYKPIKTFRNKKDVELLKRYAQVFLRDIKSGDFRPADPSHFICGPDYCGWYQICPYGQRRSRK